MATSAVIGALRVSLGLDTAAFTDGMTRAQGVMRKAGAALAAVGASVTVVSSSLRKAVTGQLDAADELGKTAQKIGVPVDALSRLGYAAELSDVSMSTLETSLGRLAKNMVGFGEDADGAVKAFAAVGVSATDVDGNLRPVEAVIADLADAFAGMEDGAAKTAAATALFGKAGRDMIPLLNEGSAAIKAMAAEADAMGIVITPDMAANAEIFNDNITRLQETLSGFGTMISADLAPILARLSDIAVKVSTVFQNLDPNLRAFISVSAGIGVVLAPIAAALGVLLIGLSALSAPILLVVAGLAALTAAAVAFWPEIVAAKDAVIAFGTDALDWIKAKPAEIVAAFEGLGDLLAEAGRGAIAGLFDGMRQGYESLKASVLSIPSEIAQTWRNIWQEQSPSKVFAEIGENAMLGVQEGMVGLQADVQAGVSSFASGLSNAFANILTEGGSFRDALQGLLASSISQIGGGLLDKGIGALLGAALPGFANGTNFAPGGLAMVGERGPELVDLPRGSRVTPNHELGGSSVVLNYAPTINAQGADASAVARLRDEMRAQAEGFHQRTLGVLADPRAQRRR